MPIFTPHRLTLLTELQDQEIKQKLSGMMEKSPDPALNMLAGDLQDNRFELRWQPQEAKKAALVVEGNILSDMDNSEIELQVMLEPGRQVSRLIWLGFMGLLFLVTLFGPPPVWSSVFPLGIMIMMYFSQEQRFSDSERNLRAVLCQQLDAEVVSG